jgi:thiol-disulfide isomerase/thioredoxin
VSARLLVRAGACVALLVASAGCQQGDKKKPPSVTRERSQAVEQAPGAAPVEAPEAAAPAASVAAKPARKLCDGRLSLQRPLPKQTIGRAAAPGVAEPAAALPLGDGVWTWLNFWAAWCVPCKEEIPRLKAWEQKLNAAGKSFQVVFVSMDDDPRQLQEFLKTQPADGLRATYWLREGKEREDWLKTAELPPDPGLPIHVLIDGRGRARCVVDGAVEDADFDQLRALIGG